MLTQGEVRGGFGGPPSSGWLSWLFHEPQRILGLVLWSSLFALLLTLSALA